MRLIVNSTQMQQHQRVRDERERRPAHRLAEAFGVAAAEVAVAVQRGADLRSRDRQEGDDRDERDHGEAGRDGQVVDDGRGVVRRGVAAQPRHDRGEHGDPEDAVGQLQQQPRVVVDRGTGFVGA